MNIEFFEVGTMIIIFIYLLKSLTRLFHYFSTHFKRFMYILCRKYCIYFYKNNMFSILRLCAIIGLFMQEKMGFGNVTSTSKTMKIIDTEKKISVLIVEDDLLVQKIHNVMMTKFGTEVQLAANGKEAVDLFLSGASFDLILIDLEMPIIDGIKVSS